MAHDIKAKLCYGSSVYRDGKQFYVTWWDEVKPSGSKGSKFEKCIHLLQKHYSKSVEGIMLARAHSEMAKGQYSI